jgi:hypothetical protein
MITPRAETELADAAPVTEVIGLLVGAGGSTPPVDATPVGIAIPEVVMEVEQV